MHGSALSDADLVARCRAGDATSWTELVQRFERYVYAIATRAYRLGDADAEDVFQEVFARTYEHLDRLQNDASIRPWIGQLTRRLSIDRLRAAARTEALPDGPAEPAEVDARLARIDDALSVREALKDLTPECQEILDRFFARDESYRAISEHLGLPMGTVASRIARCLAKLRAQLADDFRPAA